MLQDLYQTFGASSETAQQWARSDWSHALHSKRFLVAVIEDRFAMAFNVNTAPPPEPPNALAANTFNNATAVASSQQASSSLTVHLHLNQGQLSETQARVGGVPPLPCLHHREDCSHPDLALGTPHALQPFSRRHGQDREASNPLEPAVKSKLSQTSCSHERAHGSTKTAALGRFNAPLPCTPAVQRQVINFNGVDQCSLLEKKVNVESVAKLHRNIFNKLPPSGKKKALVGKKKALVQIFEEKHGNLTDILMAQRKHELGSLHAALYEQRSNSNAPTKELLVDRIVTWFDKNC